MPSRSAAGPVGERHGERAVTYIELCHRRVQRAVGERALFEDAADDRVGGAAGRRHAHGRRPRA
jgi:hypothetical protein